jgi:hypothetical protein
LAEDARVLPAILVGDSLTASVAKSLGNRLEHPGPVPLLFPGARQQLGQHALVGHLLGLIPTGRLGPGVAEALVSDGMAASVGQWDEFSLPRAKPIAVL